MATPIFAPELRDVLQDSAYTQKQKQAWENFVRYVLPALLQAGSGLTITQDPETGTLTLATSGGGGSSGSTWMMDSLGAIADPGEVSVDDLDPSLVTTIRIAGVADSGGDYSALWMALASPSHITLMQDSGNFGRYGVITTGQTLDGDFQIDVDPLPVAYSGAFVVGQSYVVTVDLIGSSGSTTNAVTSVSSSAGVLNIDCDDGDYFTLALSENITSITFSNLPAAGVGATKFIRITQGAVSPYTITFPASFIFTDGSDTLVTAALSSVTLLGITTFDQGTIWDATMQERT